jgi:hypothetical protein
LVIPIRAVDHCIGERIGSFRPIAYIFLPGVSAFEPCSHPFGIIVCPNIFFWTRGCYVVKHAVFPQEQWHLVGLLEEASDLASRFYFDTFGLKIHKRNYLR